MKIALVKILTEKHLSSPLHWPRCFCLGLLSAFVLTPLLAQSPRLYSTGQGLINTRISDVSFDTENFLWVSTEMGLARFNGQNFTTYLANDDDPYSLHSNAINCVYEDPAGRHWVGTSDGLYYFCRTENKFTHYDLRPDSAFSISISQIVAHPSRPNILLVSTHGYGIYLFDAEKRLVEQTPSMELSHQLDKYNLTTMIVDSHNNLWVLLRESINVVQMGTSPQRVQLNMSADVEADVLHTPMYAVLEDEREDCVYIGGERGVFVCDLKSMTVRRLKLPSVLSVHALQFGSIGDLLIGTENQGLYSYDLQSAQLHRVDLVNCPCDMEHSKIHSIALDNQQNLWLGLFQQGLMIVPAATDLFHYYPVSTAPNQSNLANVSCFAILSDAHRLAGTDGSGLLEYDGATIRHYTASNSELQSNAVISLAATEGGVAYVGTFGSGLYQWRNGKLSRPHSLDQLQRSSVMCQVYDSTTHILYIGTNGHGIYAYNTLTDTLRPVASGACNAYIVSLALDAGRTLWAGTESHTVSIELDNEVVHVVDESVAQKMRIAGIVPDSTCVWLGGNKGLWRYDRITRQLTSIEDDVDRRGEVVIAMAKGNDGALWMATNFGVTSYDPTTGDYLDYKGDELSMVGSFSEGAVATRADGHILFGGDNGLLAFNPITVSRYNTPLKEVFFTKLWVNNVLTDYDPASDHNVLDGSLWRARRLTLDADANSFTIGFAVQEYGNPSAIRYAYRLEGYDDEWRELPSGANNAVNFTQLPWGTYTLQVRAFTHDGQKDNGSFKQLTVVVLTPWYAQWWAWLIYIALILAVAWVVVVQLRQRAHQRRLLIRTEHKQQIKEAKLQLFTSISHEIKTPLTLILSPLRSLMDKKVDNATASVYELMYRNAMRILMLVNQQMDVRKIDNGKLKLKMVELDVQHFFITIMDYYNHAAMSHQISFEFRPQCNIDNLTVWGDPDQLDKVFFNLLSNAFKFTPNHGTVRLSVNRAANTELQDARIGEVLEVSVFNSGSVLTQTDIEHIFERFYQGSSAPEYAGSGIGLNLAHQLILLHHGAISARNIEQEGVEFRVILPLGKAHLQDDELAPAQPTPGSTVINQVSDMVMSHNEMVAADNREDILAPAEAGAEGEAGEEMRRPVTVMLVDDDKAFLDYVCGELKDYRVITASSGNEAWGQLLVSAPDVVVTDVKMPNGDGYELCHRIKRNIDTDNIPVIVLTSESSQESAEQAMQCEADRFLNKPLNVNLLRGAIEQSLKVRRNILSKARRTDVGFEYNQVQMESADTKLMQHVMESIRKHISDSDFNVEQLSKEVGISRVHLNRKMKELLGTSPSTLIRSVRLKQAAFLLIDNDVTVAEIAYSVGFSSPSYFTSNFTSYFGMTPKAFVQNYLKNPNDEKLKKLLE